MAHILVVCTANICRSPVAEALLRDRLGRAGLDDWTVSSAGTWAKPDWPAAANSRMLMALEGLSLESHRSRMVDEADLARADLILGMESGHVEALRVEFPQHAEKIFLLSQMVGQSYSVADPYGGPITGYQRMVEEITRLVDDGLPRIVELARVRPEEAGP
jgi:protein-tyrosine-phosphatase